MSVSFISTFARAPDAATPIPPILTRDQCEILSEADNVVSNNHLTLQDLNIKPSDVEEAMKKWLWRFRDGGQFAKAQ